MLFGTVALSISLFNVLIISLRQALIPERLFGRVQGAYRTLVWGLMPVGALLGGLLAALTTVPTTFIVSGAIQAVLTIMFWRLLRRHGEQVAAAHLPDAVRTPAS